MRVDRSGLRTGTANLLEAHEPPGLLHLAVSVMLRSPAGWVVQQRSRQKRLFAGAWANSCCTHPYPGEAPERAAHRRVRDELGAPASRLLSCGTFVYEAEDPVSGLLEAEFDHVFLGTISSDLLPNFHEVDEVRFLELDEASALLKGTSGAPWAATVLSLAAQRAKDL